MKKLKIQDLKVGKFYKAFYKGVEQNGVFKVGNSGKLFVCAGLEWENSLFYYNEMFDTTFEEIEREIDWTKVPRGTKVQVRNNTNQKWENAYLVSYSDNVFPLSFESSPIKDDEFTKFKAERISDLFSCCRIHPSVEIPDEWYKEVK